MIESCVTHGARACLEAGSGRQDRDGLASHNGVDR